MTDERSGGQLARAEFEAAILPLLEAVACLARFFLRGHRGDAENLVRDAALSAFQAFPRFGRGTNLRAWLFRLLRNTYVDRLRRSGREKQLIEREAELPESGAALEEFLAQARRDCSAADLEVALERLPAGLRVVLLLVDARGYATTRSLTSRRGPSEPFVRAFTVGGISFVGNFLRSGGSRASSRAASTSIFTGSGKRDSGVRTIQLKVPTIKCEACVEKIRGALTERPRVRVVEGDPDRKEVTVAFNRDRLGDAEIRMAVADAAFLVG